MGHWVFFCFQLSSLIRELAVHLVEHERRSPTLDEVCVVLKASNVVQLLVVRLVAHTVDDSRCISYVQLVTKFCQRSG